MRVAAVQFRPTKGDVVGSRERLVALARQAGEGSDLVVLPEMATSGYVFPNAEALADIAEPARGPTWHALAEVSREHGCWIVCGFPERDGRALYNSALVVEPGGDLAFVYRKTLLFDADTAWALPGNSGYGRFRTPFGTFGVGICMDINDPRFVAWVWRSRLDVLAFPTNWIDEGLDVWPYWSSRVGVSGTVLVAANGYGEDGPYRLSGRSVILRGRTALAGAPAEGDCVLRASV